MKKIILSAAALMTAVSIQAIETPTETPVVAGQATLSGGVVSGQIKAMHIISDYDNNWTPNTGSGFLGTLKYVTPEVVEGLKAGAAFYINGDTGLTDWGKTYTGGAAKDGVKPAQGMFVAQEGEEKALLGQVYLEYNNEKMIHAKAGRMILNTPLTKIQWSLMPHFYEAGVVSTQAVPGLTLTAAHINAMSYGSRSATDWSLIGEKTKSAGVAQGMIGQGPGDLEQAKFVNIGFGANVVNTAGITTIGAAYKGVENLTVNLWDYYAYDIVNNLYSDVNYKIPVMKGTKLSLSAQYLAQSAIGDKLAKDRDYSMYGAKVKIGNKKWSAYLAYNQSDDSDAAFFNAWGADPAYTSSLFSRNAYRQDVGAYKIGGHYTIMKGLKFKAGYANYGQSKTLGYGKSALAATEDATELDLMLIYKPSKAWTLKIFNAIRTSEYTTDTAEKEMNHVRLVAWYDF
jgi:hypothetical protein